MRDTKTIAIYGMSSDPQKASYFVGNYLQTKGYRIVPINPTADEILGEKCYKDLLSIPYPVDVVDIFRPPKEIPAIVDQAIEKKVPVIWMQLKLVDLPAAEKAEKAGLQVIADKCVKMEHGRYSGMMQAAGMNTEIISARKGPLRKKG